MEISNRYKPIINLVKLLLPNYVFSPRPCVGISNRVHYIDIHYIPKLDSNEDTWEYVGFLCLESIHILSIKPTEIILSVPHFNSITTKLIVDWKSIGIQFNASESNSETDYFHYYSIGLNNEDNT